VTGVFVDSFYFIALLNPADRFHEAAKHATRSIAVPLVTTAWVLVEVADALSAPGFRGHVHRFLIRLASDPNTLVVAADAAWYGRGLALYSARRDKSWSLTDCISFEVMAEFGLVEALTGDHHFEQAGYRTLLKPS